MFRVGVVGASGYAGGELLRLLAYHSELAVSVVTAHTRAGCEVGRVHPHLVGRLGSMVLVETSSEALANCDVVFLALPHGHSGSLGNRLENRLVVDCAADHRLESVRDWDLYYESEYAGAWVYGLPELPLYSGGYQRQKLLGSSRIAAPGCNASAVILALAPGFCRGLFESRDISATLVVGSSGAGRVCRSDLLASEVMASASVYAVGGIHRHLPEIIQNLARAGAKDPTLTFVPVLAPLTRGILACVSVSMVAGVRFDDVLLAYRQTYDSEEFVQVMEPGRFPRVADVLGSNRLALALAQDRLSNRVLVLVSLDNLVKGTAGAAIQSANLALDLPEGMGLSANGLAP